MSGDILKELGISGEDFSIIFSWMPPDIIAALVVIFIFIVALAIWRAIIGG